ncbi:hypothetical protein B0H63DRAFT_542649 [Podospora didyma]|uniref:Uncharacterized protein n=1 Tax=Podospora didyma TaxID=330526 RepID=A0AAE0JW05_9PEZI|nr:hypothetical protein B0H63DRAFT_542649 [Podospora didyma]
MGAGTKSDPTKIVVGDIGTSTDDGLSRATRRRLKLVGVTAGIPVVYSTEKMGEGKAALLPLPDEEFQKGSVGDLGPLPDFRVRILPVLGTMPAVFGYTANPLEYAQGKARDKMYDGILAFVQSSEEKIVRASPGAPQTSVSASKSHHHRRYCLSSGRALQRAERCHGYPDQARPSEMAEARGRKHSCKDKRRRNYRAEILHLKLRDLVCMTKDEATRHQKEVLQGDKTLADLYGPEVIELVERRQKEAGGL